jgi:Spy/CpxP family protein refolding chaperone
MRRFALLAVAVLSLSACGDSTAPDNSDISIDESAFGTELVLAGGYDAGLYQDRLANGLPDELKLSDEQRAQIRSLVEAFVASTRADREALGAILQEARQAVREKKPRDVVQGILQKGAPIRERLKAAERKLIADIDAVLTPEQRAWVLAHKPKLCRADKFPPLSDDQKAQIGQLERAFRESHKADLEAMKAILDEVAAALRAGKPRDEIASIMASGAQIARRLEAARKELRDDIMGVLTPEQKASRCFPLG